MRVMFQETAQIGRRSLSTWLRLGPEWRKSLSTWRRLGHEWRRSLSIWRSLGPEWRKSLSIWRRSNSNADACATNPRYTLPGGAGVAPKIQPAPSEARPAPSEA